jgi:hypothetical protein
MAEDTGTATSGMPVKRHSAQHTPQSSPKRAKVDLPSTVGASPPDSNADIPQSNQKSQKKRDAAGFPKSRRGKEKDNKNVGRRRRDRGSGRNEADAAEATEADPRDVPVAEKAPRLPKRQSAILLGFCGTGCAGMQMSVFDYRVCKSTVFLQCFTVNQMRGRSKGCYSRRSCALVRCPQIMQITVPKLALDVRLAPTQAYTRQETSYLSN